MRAGEIKDYSRFSRAQTSAELKAMSLPECHDKITRNLFQNAAITFINDKTIKMIIYSQIFTFWAADDTTSTFVSKLEII